MCCGLEKLKQSLSETPPSPFPVEENRPTNMEMNHLSVETEDTFASLLELAANNDIEGFKQLIERDPSGIDEVGLWYGRQKGSKQMVLEHRTPLMVAAMYGSVDVLKLILFLSEADVNRSCGIDKTTALHCAASSGSGNVVNVVKLLLAAGADPSLIDANGHRPVDAIIVSPKFQKLKIGLEELLAIKSDSICEGDLMVSTATSISNSPPLSPSSASDSSSSPKALKFNDIPNSSPFEKKEYPIDPSLPDIKNGLYSTDEFRMFSFKVRPCSRAYSHDWTECPFVHPGENARRRDPRKYHYSCVPCPDFRKGACRRGDMCEYAHGVFECWLHPAQYRTRLCKDGTTCNRRVCFFAHKQEELRPLYVSTGSAVPSPRSGTSALSAMEFAAAMSLLSGPTSPYTPPMSPSPNGIPNMGWPQQNVPTLHLQGSNLQSSRLRSSLNARDISNEDLNFDMQQHQLMNELSRLSQPSVGSKSFSRLTPSNLEDLFSSESLSPRYSEQAMGSAVFSPRHNLGVLNQFQQPQTMLSPINTSFSPKNIDHPLAGRMSPRNVDPISPMGSRVSMFAQQNQLRSLSSRDLGSSSSVTLCPPGDSWAQWAPSSAKPDWAVGDADFGNFGRSSSFDVGNIVEEPDLSWVQSLVKESPQEMKEKPEINNPNGAGSSVEGAKLNERVDESVLGAWIEQMQLDQLVAQQN